MKLLNWKTLVLSICLTIVPNAFAADMSDEAIAERIKPVGEVYLDGELEVAKAPAASSGPRAGDAVYNTFCTACHSTGAAGAPMKGDSAAWAPRIAQGDQTMFDHAWKGFNAMPAKGTCGDCSEDEIKAAIAYMIE
ncbi:cytochrome c5 family protein [Agarivorans sp. B2Z047]|uniref:c-type cytochrome n=1 Tax=Agarivorans sp. B2Z047 TaxID=2652721 RepID=UPI0014063454|nr:cytochrome c5 family protein [Agarivorans sp. B2Z047]MPW30164.1 cytochrome c5 family protein [Agarivorans sp. B2Z047]UQN43204.1 cytochrome c5 family protein [Agarivorans sp. B2Z047]